MDGLNRPSAVIGGIAVIAWGFPRFTSDVDVTIAAEPHEAREILKHFESGGFEPRTEDALEFAEQNLVLLLRHRETGVALDGLARLEFEGAALRAAVRKRFGAAQIRVPTVTDLFIFKLVAGRPQDHEDVRQLLALGLKVDTGRIETVVREFDELLDTDRLGDWVRLKRLR